MKVKTSVTLSPEVLSEMDKLRPRGRTRSDFVERALWETIRAEERRRRDAHDVEIYRQFADEYNADAIESLEYQADDW